MNYFKFILTILSFYITQANSQQTKEVIDAESLLIEGATFGDVQKIKTAIELKANINFKNKEGKSAIYYVSKLCRLDLVKLLIENGADVNISGNDKITALHWAVEYNNYKLVEYLLKKGAKIGACDGLGETPLHWAGWTGNIESAKILLKYNADPLSQNNGGTTPLDLAIRQEHAELELLFRSSINKK